MNDTDFLTVSAMVNTECFTNLHVLGMRGTNGNENSTDFSSEFFEINLITFSIENHFCHLLLAFNKSFLN